MIALPVRHYRVKYATFHVEDLDHLYSYTDKTYTRLTIVLVKIPPSQWCNRKTQSNAVDNLPRGRTCVGDVYLPPETSK
jgi:hypothetical protein